MDHYVVSASMVLTLVVCKIFFPREIFDVKLTLGNCISNPKEPHFNGLFLLMLDGIFGDTNRCGIVAIDGGWWLRVAHFFKCKSKDSGLFAI